MASSTSFNITSALFDAAVIALGKLGLKVPATIAHDLAVCVTDDSSDLYDQRALDCSFFCIVAAIAGTDVAFRNAYSQVVAAHDAADKAKADAQAAADKAAKIADLQKQLKDLGA